MQTFHHGRSGFIAAPGRGWHILLLSCVLAGLLVCLSATDVHGQANINATLGGTVLDSSGAVVPVAKVTLSDTNKGFTRTQSSQPDGRYLFPMIPAGTYMLQVEKQGFRTYVQSGIVLAIGQPATQDVTLQLGAQTQEVQVTGSAPLLNTTNATIGSEVSAKETVELPLNWRNVYGSEASTAAPPA